MFYQSFPGEAPENFRIVDVDFAVRVDPVAVIFLKVPAATPETLSLMVFPAKSRHVFPGSRFTANQVFIGFDIHDTILIPVPGRVAISKLNLFYQEDTSNQ